MKIAKDCSSIVWTTDGRCGPDFGDQVCNNKVDNNGNVWQYCSDSHWCGDTSGHNAGNTEYDYPEECTGNTLQYR